MKHSIVVFLNILVAIYFSGGIYRIIFHDYFPSKNFVISLFFLLVISAILNIVEIIRQSKQR